MKFACCTFSLFKEVHQVGREHHEESREASHSCFCLLATFGPTWMLPISKVCSSQATKTTKPLKLPAPNPAPPQKPLKQIKKTYQSQLKAAKTPCSCHFYKRIKSIKTDSPRLHPLGKTNRSAAEVEKAAMMTAPLGSDNSETVKASIFCVFCGT